MTTGLSIDHGCPSRQRMTIDFKQSKRGTNHFCEEDYCFYFDKSKEMNKFTVEQLYGKTGVL